MLDGIYIYYSTVLYCIVLPCIVLYPRKLTLIQTDRQIDRQIDRYADGHHIAGECAGEHRKLPSIHAFDG
jgi:hypothetical protein